MQKLHESSYFLTKRIGTKIRNGSFESIPDLAYRGIAAQSRLLRCDDSDMDGPPTVLKTVSSPNRVECVTGSTRRDRTRGVYLGSGPRLGDNTLLPLLL